jgi:hypothetical protein
VYWLEDITPESFFLLPLISVELSYKQIRFAPMKARGLITK